MKRKNILWIGLGLFIAYFFLVYWEFIIGLLLVGLTCLGVSLLFGFFTFRAIKSIYLQFFGPEERERMKSLRLQMKREKERYYTNTFEKQNTWED